MNLTTSLLVVTYWLVTSIEVGDLIEVAMLGHQYIHFIYTTAAIAAIAMILSNSYGVVTLCSYVCPMGATDDRMSQKRFDFLYKCLIAVIAVVFSEVRWVFFTVSKIIFEVLFK